MKKSWTFTDIINLEYFFLMDRKKSVPEEIRKRDRQIFNRIQSDKKHEWQKFPSDFSDRRMVLAWTKAMAEAYPSPGDRLSSIWICLLYFLGAAGFLTGASSVSAALYYRGNEPVNVALFLAVAVFSHWIFLFLLASRWMSRELFRFFSGKSDRIETLYTSYTPSYSLIIKIFVMAADIALKAGNRWPGTGNKRSGYGRGDEAGYAAEFDRDDLSSFAHRVSVIYGDVFFWPVFVAAQIFGLSAAAAGLAVTLVRVAFTDLAFGWQSTVFAAPETIYRLVSLAAGPWKWFFPEGTGFPDASGIAGSRIILKDGMMGLSTPDLASWWPFLCLCIVFYAFIPRFFMFAAGMMISAKAPERFEFNHADCAHLLFRMKTPVFDSSPISTAPIVTDNDKYTDEVNYQEKGSLGCTDFSGIDKGYGSVLLVSEDILDIIDSEQITAEVFRSSGNRVDFTVSYSFGTSSEKDAVHEIRKKILGSERCNVCIFMDAWQPPILEILDFIRDIRSGAGEGRMINIVLNGRPVAGSMITKPDRTDFEVWKKFINRLADPYILVTGAKDAE